MKKEVNQQDGYKTKLKTEFKAINQHKMKNIKGGDINICCLVCDNTIVAGCCYGGVYIPPVK